MARKTKLELAVEAAAKKYMAGILCQRCGNRAPKDEFDGDAHTSCPVEPREETVI